MYFSPSIEGTSYRLPPLSRGVFEALTNTTEGVRPHKKRAWIPSREGQETRMRIDAFPGTDGYPKIAFIRNWHFTVLYHYQG
jgi:hypothetical protein